MVLSLLSNTYTKIFGSRNERLVKSYNRRVAQVNQLEASVRRLTDAQLRAKTQEFRDRVDQGQKIASIMPEALAVAREVMDRAVGIRNIFNPEHRFDFKQLPGSLQPVYQKIQQQVAAAPVVTVIGHQGQPVPGWQQVEIPVEIYDAVREIYPQSRPPFRARPFNVQLIGGMVLSEGRISEMRTGEGKTIVAPLACYLACLEELQCYVVTVNDYLVQRDRDWVFPFYLHLGLSVGTIHPYHMQAMQYKQQAYQCDVVYGTNSEFGFDYLRDNMKTNVAEQVQKHRDFCIIDEVDSILIDEARTPLIISGPAHDDAPRYGLADQLARHLIQKQQDWNNSDEKVQQTIRRIKGLEGDIRNTRDKDAIPAMKQEMKNLQDSIPALEAERDQNTQYYEVEPEKKASHLTHEGIAEAQKVANVGSFYVGQNMDLPHLLENALRAHAIYQRDKDYVVQNGEVIIVDEFTGRLMIGRQWSDGLHQAIESKEKVKIKQETQTLATVTIQNFFKLFKRLAGMTGTAMTEAQEFQEIYKLEVVSIPTNVPVVRQDHNDLVFVSQKDKWNAILDEIKRMNDVGRPVLVGTTSVENSEMLAQLLGRKHAIKHEVLNAKQHEREALIVAHAGELGAVMIATNMAGRGTDIKLTAIDRAALIRHWQQRNLLPHDAKSEMNDDQLIAMAYQHLARTTLNLKSATEPEARLALCRHWVKQYTFTDADKADRMELDAALAALDKVPSFMMHRLVIYPSVADMGGLHIVGTERHESRRIDNQLRGRAGRQGDMGSSRFFLSLEDDLMKLFAGKRTLSLLSRFGMKEGDAIEHPMITRAVERAQRKVEERNFEIRKNLLEYDEVMEYQRKYFYGIRQNVLEGRDIQKLIFDYIGESVDDAVAYFLARDYVASQVSEWVRQNLDVLIESYKLRETDLASLQQAVLDEARDDVRRTVELTTGEYMSSEMPVEDWDLKGLSAWAQSRFNVDLKQSQLRQMNPDEVRHRLTEAALELLNKKDLSGLAKFLQPHYALRDLAHWAQSKFEIDLDVATLAAKPKEELPGYILEQARQAYLQRERVYPVEFILDMAFHAAKQESGSWAAEQLALWVNKRYGLDWTPQQVATMTGNDLREKFLELQAQWLDGQPMQETVAQGLAEHGSDPKALAAWAQKRFNQWCKPEEVSDPATRQSVLLDKGRQMLRFELTQLERYVLLQILDSVWKEHLYAMDQLKDSVGMRAYAEKDPRIEYKREGANLFRMMQQLVRDRVTDLIFRARLAASNDQTRDVYQDQQAEHAEADSVFDENETAENSPSGQGDGESPEQAMSRHARRAAAAQNRRDASRRGGSSRRGR